MEAIHSFIENSLPIAWLVLIASFAIIAKSADIFVENSVALANKFRIPKLVIGIVLVSLATTAPELAVSMTAALRGSPSMALGTAIGSVICNVGLALALGGLISATAIAIIPQVFKTSGIFLALIGILAFLFVIPDLTLSRWEGVVLVALFVAYMAFLFRQHRKGKFSEGSFGQDDIDAETIGAGHVIALPRIVAIFVLSLAGIILSSGFIVTSARAIALSFRIPEGVIALVLVALGTSIPEIATCIAAARKKQGALAVGNILGANIMDICWVAGASAIVNNLTLSRKEIFFMFPSMFVIVAAMLLLIRIRYRLTRVKSLIILGLYIIYLASFFLVFTPGG